MTWIKFRRDKSSLFRVLLDAGAVLEKDNNEEWVTRCLLCQSSLCIIRLHPKYFGYSSTVCLQSGDVLNLASQLMNESEAKTIEILTKKYNLRAAAKMCNDKGENIYSSDSVSTEPVVRGNTLQRNISPDCSN